MSTVVTLPPTFSSQIGTQLDFSLPTTFNGLPLSRQAAAFADGELEEILNDPEAVEEADRDEVQCFYQSQDHNTMRAPPQLPRLTQLLNIGSYRPPSQQQNYQSPYLDPELNLDDIGHRIQTPRQSRRPPVLPSQAFEPIPEDLTTESEEEEPPPRLRFEHELEQAKPIGGGVFFDYRLLLSARLKKGVRTQNIVTHTFTDSRLSLSLAYSGDMLPMINEAIEQQLPGRRVMRESCNASVSCTEKNKTRVTFKINPSQEASWSLVDGELTSLAKKHRNIDGSTKQLLVEVSFMYIEVVNQVGSTARSTDRSTMATQLLVQPAATVSSQDTPPNIPQSEQREVSDITRPLNPRLKTAELRLELCKEWECKKKCPGSSWCWIYRQVDYKLMQEDLKEWARAIEDGLATIRTPHSELFEKLQDRKKGGSKKSQLASTESPTPNTPGVVNQFYIDPTGKQYGRPATPPSGRDPTARSSPVAPLPRSQGLNRVADLREYFNWQKLSVQEDPEWESDLETAYQVARKKRWDLRIIREQKPNKEGKTPVDVMIDEGVPEAIAEQVYQDIKNWRTSRVTQLSGSIEDLEEDEQ